MDEPLPIGAPRLSTPPPLALLAHVAWVKSLARNIVADDHDAEDLAQQTLTRALEQPPRESGSPPQLRAWLAAVAHRFALQRNRSESARRRRETTYAAPAGSGVRQPADVVALAELHRRIVDAVLALAEPYRTTVLLRYFEEMPPPQIAARLMVPLATVHTRLRRALEQLRSRFAVERQPGGELALWLASPITGGIAMALKLRVTVAAALLLAAIGTAWLLERSAPRRSAVVDGSAAEAVAEAASAPATETTAVAVERSTEETRSVEPSAEAIFLGAVALTGRVVDEQGAPIAAAHCEVRLSGDGVPRSTFVDLIGDQLAAHGCSDAAVLPPRLCCTTTEDGEFRIAGLRHGLVYHLGVGADGRVPATRVVPAYGGSYVRGDDARAEWRLPAIVLRNGAPPRVRVVDGDGHGVGGATLHLGASARGRPGRPWFRDDQVVGCTDREGLADVVPPADGRWWIGARDRAGGLAFRDDLEWPAPTEPAQPEQPAQPAPPIVLTIVTQGETIVRVRDGAGTPLPGIEVQLVGRGAAAGPELLVHRLTDGEGLARFAAFPKFPGATCTATAAAPGGTLELFASSRWPSTVFDAGPGEVEILAELVAPPLPVRFVDATDRRPVAARLLLVVDAGFGDREFAWPPTFTGLATRGLGSVAADGLTGTVLLAPPQDRPPRIEKPWEGRVQQDLRFRLVADAFGHAVTWFGPFDPATLTADHPLELAIERGAHVELRVCDGRDAPLAHARAHVVGPGENQSHSSFNHHDATELRGARANLDGCITLGPLGVGDHRVTIESPGMLAREVSVTIGGDAVAPIAPAPLEVRLDDGVHLPGRVVLRPDEAADPFAVALRRRGEPSLLLSGLEPDGDFEFGPLAAGEWEALAFEVGPTTALVQAAIDQFASMDAARAGAAAIATVTLGDAAGDAPAWLELEPLRMDRERLQLDLAIVDSAQPGVTHAQIRCVTTAGERWQREVPLNSGRLAVEVPPSARWLLTLHEAAPDPTASGGAEAPADGGRRWAVAERVISAAELRAGLPPLRVARSALRLKLTAADGTPFTGPATVIISHPVGSEFSAQFTDLLHGESRRFASDGAASLQLRDLPAVGIYVTVRGDGQVGDGEADLRIGDETLLAITLEEGDE